MFPLVAPVRGSLMRRQPAVRFCIVGATGVVVNTVLLAVLVGIARFGHVPASVLATEGSIMSNFLANDRWTFADRASKQSTLARFARYNLSSCGTLVLTVSLLAALTIWFHIYYLLANLLAIAASTGANYLLSTRWTWRDAPVAGELQGAGVGGEV